MRRCWQAWTDYWFRPAPLLDLAVVRVLLAGFQAAFLLWWQPLGGEFVKLARLPDDLYAPIGPLRLIGLVAGEPLRPSPELMATVYWVSVAGSLAATAGFATRLSMALTAMGALTLHAYAWSFGELHHPEALLVIALSLLMLSPCGATLSVDDLLRRIRHAGAGEGSSPRATSADASPYAGWPLLLTQWLLVLVYLSAAFEKLRVGGSAWLNGYTMRFYLVQDGLRWGGLGLEAASLPLGILQALSIFTIWIEATFALAIVVPKLRRAYLLSGIALHTGIYLTMRAPFFQFIAIYSVFVPWSRLSLGTWLGAGRDATLAGAWERFCSYCVRKTTGVRAPVAVNEAHSPDRSRGAGRRRDQGQGFRSPGVLRRAGRSAR